MSTSSSTPSRPPLEVSWDDLQAPEVSARVEQLRAAAVPPLVRAVGAPKTSRNWRRNSILGLGVTGLVGGLVGWAASELMTNIRAEEHARGPVSHWYGSSPVASAVVFVLFIALGIGGVLASWEGIEARSVRKAWIRLRLALPILAGGGIVSGFVAQKVYEDRLNAAAQAAITYFNSTGDAAGAQDQLKGAVHLARGLGFALFGVAIGLALGAASRSKRRAVNGAIGGLVGGGVGGYLFDDIHVGGSGVASRLVAVVICGTVIGLAVGLVEQVRRECWLEIVSGGMAGKQFILYSDQTTVGSSPSCDITLIKDPQIAERHVLLQRSGAGIRAVAATPGLPFLCNGQSVLEATVAGEDVLQLGSTVLRLREKSASAPVAGPIVG